MPISVISIDQIGYNVEAQSFKASIIPKILSLSIRWSLWVVRSIRQNSGLIQIWVLDRAMFQLNNYGSAATLMRSDSGWTLPNTFS